METWKEFLEEQQEKKYFNKLILKINGLYNCGIRTYPKYDDIFKAFNTTPFNKINVIIIGQDPYHDGNADGLAFSCKNYISPSLKFIFNAIRSDYLLKEDQEMDKNLLRWSKQGVLLLNVILTVTEGKPLSHNNMGWETFTGETIKSLCKRENKPVFLLWGAKAKSYYNFIISESNFKCKVIVSEHPSAPCYRKDKIWHNSNCFIEANNILSQKGLSTVDWIGVEINTN